MHAFSARDREIAPFADAFGAVAPDAALCNDWREPPQRLFDCRLDP